MLISYLLLGKHVKSKQVYQLFSFLITYNSTYLLQNTLNSGQIIFIAITQTLMTDLFNTIQNWTLSHQLLQLVLEWIKFNWYGFFFFFYLVVSLCCGDKINILPLQNGVEQLNNKWKYSLLVRVWNSALSCDFERA